MQKFFPLLLWLLCAHCISLSAQGGAYPVFYKIIRPTLGARDTANVSFAGVARHSDGGYVWAGNYENASNGNDILLLKTDASGVVQWTKAYGRRDTIESAASIRATPDGGFIVAGTVEDASQSDMLLLKVNSTGAIMWQRSFGSTLDYDDGYAVEVLGSGKILVAGRGYPDVSSLVWGALGLTTAAGLPDASLYLGKGDETAFQDAARTADKGAIVTGSARRFLGGNTSGYDPVLVKVDSEANVIWSKRFNIAGTQLVGIRVRELPNAAGYLVIGSHVKDTTHGIFVLKTNALGVIQSIRVYSSRYYERPYSIVVVPNGSFNIAGAVSVGRDSAGVNRLNSFQMQIDSSGAVKWAKVYGDSVRRSEIHSVFYNSGGGFTLAGETYETASPLGGALLIQTNANGTMGAGCTDRNVAFTVSTLTSTDSLNFDYKGFVSFKQSAMRDSAVSVVNTNICVTTAVQNMDNQGFSFKTFPNPAQADCTIQLPNDVLAADATLFDVQGQAVWGAHLQANETVLDTRHLPNGLYFLRLTVADGRRAVAKVVVVE